MSVQIGDETAHMLDEETQLLRKRRLEEFNYQPDEQLSNASSPRRFSPAGSSSPERGLYASHWQSHRTKRFQPTSLLDFKGPKRHYAEIDTPSPEIEPAGTGELETRLQNQLKRARLSLETRTVQPEIKVNVPDIGDHGVEVLSGAYRRLQVECSDLQVKLAGVQAEADNLRQALKNERESTDNRLRSALNAVRREYNEKLVQTAQNYYRDVKRAFEKRIATLEDELERERQEKRQLIDTTDTYFERVIDTLPGR